jgi:hypothetical protein
MKASQIIPAGSLDAVCRDDGPLGHRVLVIENLAELAAAGAPAICHVSLADCATAVPSHSKRRSTPWTTQTAR